MISPKNITIIPELKTRIEYENCLIDITDAIKKLPPGNKSYVFGICITSGTGEISSHLLIKSNMEEKETLFFIFENCEKKCEHIKNFDVREYFLKKRNSFLTLRFKNKRENHISFKIGKKAAILS